MGRILDWWRDRRRRRAEAAVRGAAAERALSLAREAFAATYPERQALDNWLHVDAVEDGHVVTLLSPEQIPPRRSWWLVDAAGTVSELSHDEAAKRITMPVWR